METTNKRTNKHLTHKNINTGRKYQSTLKFSYCTIPQMAWSQPGTRPSGISVQSTTNKDDMTHIRIIHWFFEQYIYNRQAWLLETRIIGRAFIQILIMMILITETYKTVRHYLMAWLPKPSRAGGRGSCRYCNKMTYIILTTKIPTDLWILMSKLLPIFHFSDAVCKLMSTCMGHQYANT